MRLVFGFLAMGVMFPALAQEQEESEPVLEQLKGTFECSVLQTAGGDVLHLNCTETESPLAGDWDFEVYRVTRSSYSSRWVFLDLRSNVDMQEIQLRVKFHYPDNEYVGEGTVWNFNILAGQTWTETAYADYEGDVWESVEILSDPSYGNWRCGGCGAYEFADIEATRLVDPTSIQPEDFGAFIQEIQGVIYQ